MIKNKSVNYVTAGEHIRQIVYDLLLSIKVFLDQSIFAIELFQILYFISLNLNFSIKTVLGISDCR